MRSRPSRPWMACVICLVLGASAVGTAQGGLLITEFAADNSKGIKDEDGEFSDWVEIFNSSDAAVNLDGYYLTDEAKRLTKWRIPAVTLDAHRFLVIFCSGNDRHDPTSELHTSFKLGSGGDDILLVAPDGTTVVSGFRAYPEQLTDVSYGVGTDSQFVNPLPANAPARVLVPTSDIGPGWIAPDFDDGAWRQGTLAVGYGITAAPESGLVGTDVAADMKGVNASIYIRIPFEVPDGFAPDVFKLRMKYDDGFAAFLNGSPLVSRNAPDPLAWNSQSTRQHLARDLEEIDVSQQAGLLKPGRNVLAIQGLNSLPTNNDLFILPEMKLVHVGQIKPSELWYFPEPTPGEPNGQGFPELAPRPIVSLGGGSFVGPVKVELSTDLEGGTVRYTLDGTIPDAASKAYDTPIDIAKPTRVIARVFKDGFMPGIPEVNTYLIIDPALIDFDSNIPLLICTTFGKPLGTNCGGGPYTLGHASLLYPKENGRNAVTDDPALAHLCQFRRRGSSTCGDPKFSFNVEFDDLQGRDQDVEVFDFPKESDYIMYGPYDFDRALMRNAVAYWMSREVGQWAARTRFVECFFNSTATPVNNGNYMGVYIFMEKNKQGKNRIDVHSMSPQDNTEPALTGGYVMKRDRIGEGEVAITAGGYSSLVFVYPKAPTTAQKAYMTKAMTAVISSLKPTIGKQEDNPLIDFTGWIDHHILTWYPKNVDAFRLSGYFYKDRDGPVVMGPVWDYDRTMGCSSDDRARDPEGWDNNLQSGDGGTRYFQSGGLGSWYSFLFNNSPPTTNTPWNIAYRARWRELRRSALKSDKIAAQVDAWGAELAEAAERNFKKWPGTSPRFGGFKGEVDHLRDWLVTRADWIDGQFIERPRFNPDGGQVAKGAPVEILVDSGSPVYYTLDGADPRTGNGQPASSAKKYEGPIAIDQNVRVRARALEPDGLWSAVSEAVFVVSMPQLMITEVMYSPAPPTPAEDPTGRVTAAKMEFIEIANVGNESVPLIDVRISRGVTFDFDDVPLMEIAAGEVVVIVADPAAFTARYGQAAARIAGQFKGSLSDTGEPLNIIGPLSQTLVDFSYSSTWYPETAGQGRSLVNVDPHAPPEGLSDAARWKASDDLNGSPGRLEGSAPGGRIRPGDANGDGALNVTDAIRELRMLFQGAQDSPCAGGAEGHASSVVIDWDGNATFNVADAIQILQYLFQAGPPHSQGTACVRLVGCQDVCSG